MKTYQNELTKRRRVPRGTEEIAFPCQAAELPRRGVSLDLLTVFHLTFDATKPARSS